MKKTIFFCSFVLIASLACFVTDIVTPVPAIPTFDANQISTIVVQTAQEALILSATVTAANLATETPTETPTATLTLTNTVTNIPTFTSTPSLTNTVTLSPSAAITVIYVYITGTLAPATKTFIPATATKAPALPATVTDIPIVTFTSAPLVPPTNTAVAPSTATNAPPASATSKPPTNTAVKVTCPQMNTSFEARVIELINAQRAKAGLSALNYQSQLTAAAQLHSADMACNNYFSHTGLDGSNFSDRAARQGYSIGYGGENIAAGYSTPNDVVQGWMNSPGHKANILGENYTDIGVGYAYSNTSSYGAYWTAVFGSP